MGLSMKRSLILLTAVGTLAGCVSFGASEPPPFLMSLTSDIKVDGGAERSGQQADALVVRLPSSPQKLNTLRVPVQTRATGIAYLKDAIWVDKPVRLFHGMLTETIAAKNERLVLTSTQAGGKAEHYLSGELVNFGLDGPRLEVVVTYDAVKMKVGQPVEKRRFEAREPVYAAEPGPVGESLNKAANKVVDEVADWIG